MYKIIISPRFKRSYKKFIKKYPYLLDNIDFSINQLSENPFNPAIKTHKLSGELYELYACKCGYDCRIIFSIEKVDGETDSVILLVDLGTHDNVY